MKTINKSIGGIIIVVLTCVFSLTAYSQEKKDSISRLLNEVTVTAENQKIETKSNTYYPTSKVKRAAQNAIDLLQRMAINQILIDHVNNSVMTNTRENVVIYVNYLPAGDAEIEGLKSTDVSKVEYIDYPTDPRFEGNYHVINIILHQYAYGGYTKLSDRLETISDFENRGSLFSRFAYRRMTYDLYLGSTYSNSTHGGYSTNSVFHLADGIVNRNEILKSAESRSINIPVTFRATYATDKVSISNIVGFSFNDRLRNNKEGTLMMGIPGNMGEYSYRTSSPSISRSLTWSGNYHFSLPAKWSLSVRPSFAYTHGNYYSLYDSDADVADVIINNSWENAYQGTLSIGSSKTFAGGSTLSFGVDGGITYNKVKYLGTSPSLTDTRYDNLSAMAQYSFRPGKNFELSLLAAMVGSWYDTDGIKNSNFNPIGAVIVSYLPNKKNRFQMTLRYASTTYTGIYRQENVLRQNEYLYQTGNPLLNSFANVTANLSYTFRAGNNLSLQAFSRYLGWLDRVTGTYTLYDNGNAVLYKPENSGDFTRVTSGINITCNLLSNALTLQASPTFTHSSSTGFHHIHKNHFSYMLDAQYYVGNFNFSASYQSRDYTMGPVTGDISKTASYYGFSLGWANGAWSLSLSAYNLFRTSYKAQWDSMKTDVYDTYSVINNPSYRCSLRLGATYTFGYGKKVRRGGEVGATYGASSAALKTGD